MRLWNMNFRLQLVKLCLEDIKPSQNVRQAPFEAEHAGDPKKWHVNCSYVLSGSQRWSKMSLRSGYLNGKIMELYNINGWCSSYPCLITRGVIACNHHILMISPSFFRGQGPEQHLLFPARRATVPWRSMGNTSSTTWQVPEVWSTTFFDQRKWDSDGFGMRFMEIYGDFRWFDDVWWCLMVLFFFSAVSSKTVVEPMVTTMGRRRSHLRRDATEDMRPLESEKIPSQVGSPSKSKLLL